MSQNGQAHFKNLAVFADHFGTLCIKGLPLFAYIVNIFKHINFIQMQWEPCQTAIQ